MEYIRYVFSFFVIQFLHQPNMDNILNEVKLLLNFHSPVEIST